MIVAICCVFQAVICERSGRQRRGLQAELELTQAEIDIILGKHNEYRSEADAKDMKLMTWDADLAAASKNYAEQCKWEHSDTSNGENLYAASGRSRESNINRFTTGWHDEINFYTYANRSCAQGKMCGHYTQVVWANSFKLGCGFADCTIEAFGAGLYTLVVCQYSPPGNWRGQFPFAKGDACTECADGDYCHNSMCANTARDGIDFRELTTTAESTTKPAASPTSSGNTSPATRKTTTVESASTKSTTVGDVPTMSTTTKSTIPASMATSTVHVHTSATGGTTKTTTSEGPVIEITTAPPHGTSPKSGTSPPHTTTDTPTTRPGPTDQGFTTRPTKDPNERCSVSGEEYREYVAKWRDDIHMWRTKFDEWKEDFEANTCD